MYNDFGERYVSHAGAGARIGSAEAPKTVDPSPATVYEYVGRTPHGAMTIERARALLRLLLNGAGREGDNAIEALIQAVLQDERAASAR